MTENAVQRPIKVLLLLGMGGFLLSRIVTNTLFFYISERFAWLTGVAVVGFVLVGLSYWWMRNSGEGHEACGCGDEHHAHDPDRHGHGHGLDWRGVALVALPLVLGFLVPPRPLGASALQNRDISVGVVDSVLPAAVRQAQEKPTTERTLLDWVLAFQAAPQSGEQFDGAAADVTGFVYQDESTDDDSFWLARFVVGCCVADASPVAVRVQWTQSTDLERDAWVRVRGSFRQQANGEPPVLHAQQVEAISPPSQPYLYP